MIQSIGNGVCRISPTSDTNSVLEVHNSQGSHGGPVSVKRWNSGAAEEWILSCNGDGTFRLTPKANVHEALGVADGKLDPALPFQTATWNGSTGQRWYLASP
jgi:hypothetical protein